MTRFAKIAFGTVAITLAVGAHADEDVFSNSVRVGAYYITYDTTADDLRGPYVPAGVNIKLKDVVTPYFAYTRRLTSHFSAELAIGAPPLTKTYGKGPAKLGSVPYNDQEVVTARWLAKLRWPGTSATAMIPRIAGGGRSFDQVDVPFPESVVHLQHQLKAIAFVLQLTLQGHALFVMQGIVQGHCDLSSHQRPKLQLLLAISHEECLIDRNHLAHRAK